MDAMDISAKTEVALDTEKMLVVLSIFILSAKTEVIEPPEVVERLVQIFNGIITNDDYKVCVLFDFIHSIL